MDTQNSQDESAVKEWAQLQNLPYFDTRTIIDAAGLRGILTTEQISSIGVIPLQVNGSQVLLGITDKTDPAGLQKLPTELPDKQLTYAVVSIRGFARILNLLEISDFRPDLYDGKLDNFIRALGNADQKDVFRLIVQLAYLMGASDIHIEPTGSNPRMRFRIDGILHPITDIPKERYQVALSDVQTRAGMRWGGDTPQSGRISEDVILAHGEKVNVNLRLETIPQFHGEEIVVRLFNFDRQYLELKNLGLNAAQRKEVTRLIAHPYGMVLTVGPTGSGKTSTLYAIINQMNNPEIKIVTLEDPVEYELPGITQIPVHTDDKASFADGLRAVLREDPNVIMVGEIRDIDTARTALQAALTGHLVLSTFHANTAASAITRLSDMIQNEDSLLASSLQLIIAQRLVRRLCMDCRKGYKPKPAELKQLQADLGALLPENPELYESKGCDKCQGFGYKGRISILELLVITPEIQRMVAAGNMSAQAIEDMAKQQGMHTMRQDGLLKALEGETSVEEVLRIT